MNNMKKRKRFPNGFRRSTRIINGRKQFVVTATRVNIGGCRIVKKQTINNRLSILQGRVKKLENIIQYIKGQINIRQHDVVALMEKQLLIQYGEKGHRT